MKKSWHKFNFEYEYPNKLFYEDIAIDVMNYLDSIGVKPEEMKLIFYTYKKVLIYYSEKRISSNDIKS